MSIEDMFSALEAEADVQCKQVTAEAEARVEAILREAKTEAENIRSRRLEDAEQSARARAAQVENAARLAQKRDVAALRGGAVESVFASAQGRLTAVRDSEDYSKLFAKLLEQAAACAADEDFDVLVDPADIEIAKKVVSKTGGDAAVRGDIETAGGVVVATCGGKIVHRNTLESRLDKMRGSAQATVARILFE